MSARNRELLALVPASALVTAGFAAIFIQRSRVIDNVSLTYGLIFLGLCAGTHLLAPLPPPAPNTCLFPPLVVPV
ncbi:MAG: FtsW/RodA/SpoVE family cell cycle protein, partial [Solirubrobacteraceae bacterium]